MGFPGVQLKFEHLDTTAQEAVSDYYSRLVAAGVLTVNDAREELGYQPLESPATPPRETEVAAKAHKIGLVKALQIARELL
ncbi:MAG: hypothetical protein PHW74_07265 [Desulfobacca sp.]|nr:hypothetical protein [Desulfobacca sp.]